MKFLNESYLLEQEINKREPMSNGKIKVSSEEWDMLWDRQLGSTDIQVKDSCENTHKWFSQVKDFTNKYECM